MIAILPFIFIFGTIVGSFLNVVILRYGTGKGIMGWGERSMCFSCSKTLEWYELLPVVSFFLLKGRCSVCKSKISWQYPLVELATGFIFAAIFFRLIPPAAGIEGITLHSVALVFLCFAIWAILIVITVYDWRHKIIPDALVYAFSGLSLIAAYFFPGVVGGSFLGSIVAGVSFFVFFGGLWFVSGGRWLGFGDAKLVLGVGFFLGLIRGASALVLSFWIGAVVSVLLLGWQRIRSRTIQSRRLQGRRQNLTMKSEIPFAPFIILGTLIAFFWYVDILGIGAFF